MTLPPRYVPAAVRTPHGPALFHQDGRHSLPDDGGPGGIPLQGACDVVGIVRHGEHPAAPLGLQGDAQALEKGHGVLGGKGRERPVEELPAPGAGGHHLLRRAVVGHVAAALAGDAHLAPQLPVLVKQAHRKAPLQGGARGHQPGGAAAHH